MVEIKTASVEDSKAVAELIFKSAPVLLPKLFGNVQTAKEYLFNSCQLEDGQYSAARHKAVFYDSKLVGAFTLWHSDMGNAFHRATLESLTSFLPIEQIAKILHFNEQLLHAFPPPKPHELCIGHLSVDEEYQGMGIGKKIIALAINEAKTLNKSHLVLDVDEQNEQAVSFYEACRFTVSSATELGFSSQHFLRMAYKID